MGKSYKVVSKWALGLGVAAIIAGMISTFIGDPISGILGSIVGAGLVILNIKGNKEKENTEISE